jgi:hypothetical protein
VASDSRALTLKLLADTADFQKKLANGSKDIDSIGDRAKEFGKKAAIAFAAAGAAVTAFAADAIKAAAEDEKGAKLLAENLKLLAGATDSQVAATEKFISQTSKATATADDKLRPALGRLVRSTEDVEEAQNLLNLALDIAAATGKDVDTVATALGKAYDGNTTALGRLGIGLDTTKLKNQDVKTTMAELSATYGDFAENAASTTEGKFASIKIAQDEIKESIGTALLPAMQELTTFILEEIVPTIEAFVAGLTGQDGATESLNKTQQGALDFGKKVRGLIKTVIDFKDEIKLLGIVLGTVFVVGKIATFAVAMVKAIKSIIVVMNALRVASILAGIAAYFAANPLAGVAFGAAIIASIATYKKLAEKQDVEAREMGGPVSAARKYLVGEKGPELFVPNTNGTIIPNNKLGGQTVNITVNGAIDPASTARQIADLLNNEAAVSGSFNNLGLSRFATRTA